MNEQNNVYGDKDLKELIPMFMNNVTKILMN